MALFDRFLNPIWYKASRLSPDRQCEFAFFVGLYDYFRRSVAADFVAPVCSRLKQFYRTIPRPGEPLFERLVDEAVIAVLRSCSKPPEDSGAKLRFGTVSGIPDVLGVWALCDANHRSGSVSATVLEQTHYSSQPSEARVQLLRTWMMLCGISEPRFLKDASNCDALESWDTLTGALISGALKGFGGSEDALLLSKAKHLAAATPIHRRPLVIYLVERLLNATEPTEGLPKRFMIDAKADRPQVCTGPGERPAVRLLPPDFVADGRAVLQVPEDANFTSMLQQMAFVARGHMKPQDMQVAARWVAAVTGRAVRGGVWEREHEEAFVRGFERFYWEGNAPSEELHDMFRKMRNWYRELYPRIEATPLDIALTDEMRKLYGRILGGNS